MTLGKIKKTNLRNAPFFAFFAKEWLVTAATELTLEQQGALVNLLCYAWIADPAGSLPDDDAKLALYSGLKRKWAKNAPVLRSRFLAQEGRLWSSELVALHNEMVDRSERRAANGRKGAASRWGKDGLGKDRSLAPSDKPFEAIDF